MTTDRASRITATRIGDSPIIRPHMDTRMGDNINGPSMIRVPDWVPAPLGRYYLYFAHHDGQYIRLAFSDRIEGPWRMHEPGVLPLKTSHFQGHIASPDVIVDHDARRIRLYYHGSDARTDDTSPQVTRVALSADGLTFKARPEVLGPSYMRVVKIDGWHYAMAMPGQFLRSKDGLTDFETGPTLFAPNTRHAALLLRQDRLHVVLSRAGDCPERLLTSNIRLTPNWHDWQAAPLQPLLSPKRDYEGGTLPRRPSERGIARTPTCELRDPAIIQDGGKTYLLYTVAGEQGIALARLNVQPG